MAGEQVIQYMELLTGGSSTAVDGIDGDDRGDGEAISLDDITYANVSGVHYVYKYTATAAVESVPDIIRPDVNNDPTKAWVLQEYTTHGTWTPTWTNATGATTGTYTKTGRLVFYTAKLVVTAVTGNVAIGNHPFTISGTHLPNVLFLDSGATYYIGSSSTTGTTVYAVNITDGSVLTLSATIPFTWASGDEIHVSGTYQVF
ncbi:MAG: hypothetical protein GY865_08205 [candidate division Zixibacteria bacterium]|nr:hypothetical protein [candidate division Zixibacteria bacterium]